MAMDDLKQLQNVVTAINDELRNEDTPELRRRIKNWICYSRRPDREILQYVNNPPQWLLDWITENS